MIRLSISIFLMVCTGLSYAVLDEDLISKYNIVTKEISTSKYYSKVEKKKLKHYFSLNLVHLEGTDWSKKQIKQRVKRIVNTYKTCNIGIKPLRIITMEAPFGYIDIGDGERADLISKELENLSKPIIFYIRWDLKSTSPAWAHRNLLNKGKPKVNTAWMTFFSSTLEFPDPDYSIEAHEIGHILLDQGHDFSDKRNLMSYDGLLNSNILTAEQCEKIKRSPLVSKK